MMKRKVDTYDILLITISAIIGGTLSALTIELMRKIIFMCGYANVSNAIDITRIGVYLPIAVVVNGIWMLIIKYAIKKACDMYVKR